MNSERDYIKKTPAKIISEATGYSESTISRVRSGERKNSDISDAIIIMNQTLAEAERQIIQKFQSK